MSAWTAKGVTPSWQHRGIHLQRIHMVRVKVSDQHGVSRSRNVLVSGQVGAHSSSGSRPKVVGLGLACWDFLAQVAAFPKPDEKLRTQRMEASLAMLTDTCFDSRTRLVYPYVISDERRRQLCQCTDGCISPGRGCLSCDQNWR